MGHLHTDNEQMTVACADFERAEGHLELLFRRARTDPAICIPAPTLVITHCCLKSPSVFSGKHSFLSTCLISKAADRLQL